MKVKIPILTPVNWQAVLRRSLHVSLSRSHLVCFGLAMRQPLYVRYFGHGFSVLFILLPRPLLDRPFCMLFLHLASRVFAEIFEFWLF